MPGSVASPYGQWPEQATRELQLGAMPPDLQHALDSGTEDGLLDPQLQWALSVRVCPYPLLSPFVRGQWQCYWQYLYVNPWNLARRLGCDWQ